MITQSGPSEGPKVIPVELNMAEFNAYILDLTEHITNKWISYVQSVWIDNTLNDYDLTILVNGSNQMIKADANTQGWYSILATNPPIFRIWQEDVIDAGIVRLSFVNFPISLAMLGSGGSGGTVSNVNIVDSIPISVDANIVSPDPLPVSLTTPSVDIVEFTGTLTGGSDEVIAAGAAANYAMIYNPIGNNPVTINIAGEDATLTGIVILAGGSFELTNGCSNPITAAGTMGETLVVYGGVYP